MVNNTTFVLCICLVTIFSSLCHAAIPARELELTRALNNNTSNVCFSDADCNSHGRCINMTSCMCDKGWTTTNDMTNANSSCLYEQRRKLVAFLLSFFVGTLGVDWFYLSRGKAEYIVAGVFKILLGCGCCCGWPLSVVCIRSDSAVLPIIGHSINALFSFGSFAWWIIDWARMLADKFPDGNGVGLQPF